MEGETVLVKTGFQSMVAGSNANYDTNYNLSNLLRHPEEIANMVEEKLLLEIEVLETYVFICSRISVNWDICMQQCKTVIPL